MLYPRTTKLNGKDVLVEDTQGVGMTEHMGNCHRILFLSGTITGEMELHNLLMTLDSFSHDPIRIVITSLGGDLDATFLLYDTIKLIKSPVETLGRFCASAAAIILAAGSKRYLLPNCRTMLHLPSGMMAGDSRDFDIQHKQMESYRNKMADILIECGVKKNRGEILTDIDRDFWLDSTEAIKYGLADSIFDKETWAEWIKGEGKNENSPGK